MAFFVIFNQRFLFEVNLSYLKKEFVLENSKIMRFTGAVKSSASEDL